MANLQRRLTAALRWAHGRAVPLSVHAPGSVQVELWRQPNRLVKGTGDSVRLTSGGEAVWEYSGGETVIAVPELDLYGVAIVKIEAVP